MLPSRTIYPEKRGMSLQRETESPDAIAEAGVRGGTLWSDLAALGPIPAVRCSGAELPFGHPALHTETIVCWNEVGKPCSSNFPVRLTQKER